MYLATTQILAKRVGKRHDSHLVLATLHQACATGRTATSFHSDPGTEFMAQRCTHYLEDRGIQISVSNVASPWQNGFIESFLGHFKHELEAIYRHNHYYNYSRIHTALKMPPVIYAARFSSDTCLHKLGT